MDKYLFIAATTGAAALLGTLVGWLIMALLQR